MGNCTKCKIDYNRIYKLFEEKKKKEALNKNKVLSEENKEEKLSEVSNAVLPLEKKKKTKAKEVTEEVKEDKEEVSKNEN